MSGREGSRGCVVSPVLPFETARKPIPRTAFHSACGKLSRNPADKTSLNPTMIGDCGKRLESPSFFRTETRNSDSVGTAILSKPLQRDAEFFRTHPLLPLLRK
jgi:hypothetical protein